MRGSNLIAGFLGGLAIFLTALPVVLSLSRAACAAADVQDAPATTALIHEVQFMLARLGIDPGPIDGVAGPQTLRAVRKFQVLSGMPEADLVSDGKISAVFLTHLRSEASRAILGGEKKPTDIPEPRASVSPPVPAAAPQPAAPAPDPFAACTFNPGDFRIGATEYTPEKFLQVGFDGSTARAVASLKDRLDEARQIAGNIGGSALTEVQRQARILGYFSCRLKIEQASDGKK